MFETELKTNKNDAYDIAFEAWQDFLSEARYDLELSLGAKDAEDVNYAEKMKRFFYGINRLKRQINLIHGYEIKNRHILKIGPIGGEDDKACQQHTGLVMQEMQGFGGYDTLSEAFRFGPLITASNLVEIYKDRFGDIQFGRLGYNEFLLDPHIKKTDLSDCNSILIGRWLPKDKIRLLIPKDADKIPEVSNMDFSTRWTYQSPPFGGKDNRFLYEEWWRKETEFTEMVISRATGQEIPFKDMVKVFLNGDTRQAQRLIAETKLKNGIPALEKYSKPKDKIKLTIFVNDEPVFNGLNPLGIDEYNLIWLHGEWCPELDRSELKLQSFARILRDPQKMLDRRMNQAMDIIESQIQSGRLMRDKYIKNPEDAYKSGQGVVIHAKDDAPDALALEEIFKQITPAQIGAGIFQLMEILEQSETSIGGLNNEILGNDDAEIPAILASYRTGQALTGQQGLFNGFRQAKRQIGVKLVKAHQKNYPPDKVQRRINQIPVPTFYEPDFTKYDCTPTEGILTETQQNLFYLELKELRQMYPDAAQIIPISAIIEASPMQFKDKLVQIIKQSEQNQQKAQAMALQDKQRQDKLIEATTQTKLTQSQESIAQSAENRSNAELDRIRTMAEARKLGVEPQLSLIDKMIKLEDVRLQAKRLDRQERKNAKRNRKT